MNEICELLRSQPLRIGISTRALFDLEEEHLVFVSQGVQAYSMLQLQRENTLIAKGPGFEVVERLLRLNEPNRKPYVEVFLLSRNSPDLSLRAFNSIAEYGLAIKAGSFTSGRSLGPFISAWDVDLFLSNEVVDVQAAVSARLEIPGDEVRIAFDGDAVVFSAESDEIYKERGLAAFLQHEQENAKNANGRRAVWQVFEKADEGVSRVRIAIVTARNAPAHARVVHTLRAWGTPGDEAHFVGIRAKAPILVALGAHIFFDDQERHILGASTVVAAGHVPGPHSPDEPVIPAG